MDLKTYCYFKFLLLNITPISRRWINLHKLAFKTSSARWTRMLEAYKITTGFSLCHLHQMFVCWAVLVRCGLFSQELLWWNTVQISFLVFSTESRCFAYFQTNHFTCYLPGIYAVDTFGFYCFAFESLVPIIFVHMADAFFFNYSYAIFRSICI